METEIAGELGMEGGRQHRALPAQDGMVIDTRQDVHAVAGPFHIRGSDEDGGHPAHAGDVEVGFEGVDLAAEGVAAHGEVDDAEAALIGAPVGLVQELHETGHLPVPLFCAGGIATPADASLVMQLGAEAVFVGSGIFKSEDPAVRAKAIVEATAHFRDPHIVAKVSRGLGEAMRGQDIAELDVKLAERGW